MVMTDLDNVYIYIYIYTNVFSPAWAGYLAVQEVFFIFIFIFVFCFIAFHVPTSIFVPWGKLDV